jgi:hypothetical protein
MLHAHSGIRHGTIVVIREHPGDIDAAYLFFKECVESAYGIPTKFFCEGISVHDEWTQKLLKKRQEYQRAKHNGWNDEYADWDNLDKVPDGPATSLVASSELGDPANTTT